MRRLHRSMMEWYGPRRGSWAFRLDRGRQWEGSLVVTGDAGVWCTAFPTTWGAGNVHR